MTRKERWLAAFALLFAILPFILLASTLQLMPKDIILVDFLLASVTVSKYNYLFLGLFCLVPILLVIAARVLKEKKVVGHNFASMVIVALAVGILFLVISAAFVISQVRGIDLLMRFDFFGGAAILLSLLMGLLVNFFPDIKQNDIIGIKNRFTASSAAVWNKVHKDATDVFMGCYFGLAILISGLSIGVQYRFGYIHLAMWVVLTIALLVWAHLHSKSVARRLALSRAALAAACDEAQEQAR